MIKKIIALTAFRPLECLPGDFSIQKLYYNDTIGEERHRNRTFILIETSFDGTIDSEESAYLSLGQPHSFLLKKNPTLNFYFPLNKICKLCKSPLGFLRNFPSSFHKTLFSGRGKVLNRKIYINERRKTCKSA